MRNLACSRICLLVVDGRGLDDELGLLEDDGRGLDDELGLLEDDGRGFDELDRLDDRVELLLPDDRLDLSSSFSPDRACSTGPV